MKKIPTVFERQYENHKVVGISDTFTSDLAKKAFLEGEATLKWDGSCCAIIDGELYKRYDAKKGKKAPEGAIPCCEADPITGHHPHWVKVDENNPADKWFIEAYKTTLAEANASILEDGTYEAVGKHFQGNPYNLTRDLLEKHGMLIFENLPRTFEDIREFLENPYVEGIVFWLDGEPVAKIKRSDFGFEWNKR